MKEDDREEDLKKVLSKKIMPDDITRALFESTSQKTVDTETYIRETQSRVLKALKQGLKFEATLERSDDFLRKHINSKVALVVLYADLVSSTKMSSMLPVNKLATIIQTFSQEMTFVVENFSGYVLKYVGDAVIAYFPTEKNYYLAYDAVLGTSRSMIEIITSGINPILEQHGYPELHVKIGIDSGEHAVIQYGQGKRSHVDIIGYAISMAAKITALAEPDQIVVSKAVYNGIHPSMKKRFRPLDIDPNKWNYTTEKGEIYKLYALP